MGLKKSASCHGSRRVRVAVDQLRRLHATRAGCGSSSVKQRLYDRAFNVHTHTRQLNTMHWPCPPARPSVRPLTNPSNFITSLQTLDLRLNLIADADRTVPCSLRTNSDALRWPWGLQRRAAPVILSVEILRYLSRELAVGWTTTTMRFVIGATDIRSLCWLGYNHTRRVRFLCMLLFKLTRSILQCLRYNHLNRKHCGRQSVGNRRHVPLKVLGRGYQWFRPTNGKMVTWNYWELRDFQRQRSFGE